jgi:hypothetical protein
MITYSSCFYIIKSKFNPSIYIQWMNQFISIVNHFNLVIYTNEESRSYIMATHPNIKIIIKPLNQFYNYKYKDYWIKNHEKNILLNERVCWEVNMLWSEKIAFVKETIDNQYFNTEYYGWCDIGYFRNRNEDLHTMYLKNWSKYINIDEDKIHYACVNNSNLHEFIKNIQDRNEYDLPKIEIPSTQNTIAGGFFILHKKNIEWWFQTYDKTLNNYFKHNYLVKDDQIILVDCIFTHLQKFKIYKEKNQYDNWFMFQRILNQTMEYSN